MNRKIFLMVIVAEALLSMMTNCTTIPLTIDKPNIISFIIRWPDKIKEGTELYDLSKDVEELHDVAYQYPEILEKMIL